MPLFKPDNIPIYHKGKCICSDAHRGDSRSFVYEEHVRDAATPFFRRNIATRNGGKKKTRGKTSRPTLCGAFLRVCVHADTSPTREKETFKSRRMYAT